MAVAGAPVASSLAEGTLPPWLARPLAVVLTAVLVLGVGGLALAAAGMLEPLIFLLAVVPAATVASVGTVIATRSLPPAPARASALAVGVLLFAVTVVTWNGLHHAEHLVVERDPGVYATTAAWLADHGDLHVAGLEGPFADNATLRPSGAGFSIDDETLSPQFPHLTATVLAIPAWLDDQWMFLVNPVLGGVALLCWFALGSRLGGTLGAAAGVALLASTFPFNYFTRDTYSEPLAMVLLAGGLWVLTMAHDRRSPGLGVLAGALVGATCLARIDGFVPLVPFAVVLGAELRLSLRAQERRRAAAYAAALGAGTLAAGLGALETWAYSEAYFDSDLAPRLPSLVAAALLGALAAFALAPLLWRVRDGRVEATAPLKVGLVAVAGVAVAYLLWSWFMRPDPVALRDALAQEGATGARVEPQARTLVGRWMAWYLGPTLVVLGWSGLLALGAAACLRTARRPALPFVGVVLASTLVYLHTPSITPDHPWAIRRFIAVAIPGLTLSAGLLLGWLWERRGRGRRTTQLLSVGLGVVSLLGTLTVLKPLRNVEVGRGLVARVDDVCAVAQEEPSAILVAPEGLLSFTLPHSVGAWCDVPTAGATEATTAADVQALAEEWQQEGRRLLVLGSSLTPFDGALGDPVLATEPLDLIAPEVTYDRGPKAIASDGRVGKANQLYVFTP